MERFSDLGQRLSQVSFSAKRQKPVNVAVRELALVIEVFMLLPGKTAAQVRTQAATILVRFLGGDLGLLQDVTKMHNVQTFPREVNPANWRASFGEAVAQCEAPVPQVFDEAKERANTTASHLYTFALACMADVYKVGRSKGPVERCRFTQKTPRQVGRFTGGVLSRAAFRAACQITQKTPTACQKKNFDQEMMICMRSSQRYERKMIRKQSDVRIKIVVLVH